MDPIAVTVLIHGEAAVLHAPVATATYDPTQDDDYEPDAPAQTPLRGVPELKIEHVNGATGAFTISATTKPAGLVANQSKLEWRGVRWTVLKWRHRTWRGATNGFTLYLGT